VKRNHPLRRVLGANVLTTGDVAAICKVAPRTVAKWIDSGALRGYRIPGSLDRRVPLKHLIEFCRQWHIPCDGLDPATVVLAVAADLAGAAEALLTARVVSSAVALGHALGHDEAPPAVVVIDGRLLGRSEAVAACQQARHLLPEGVAALVGVVDEDEDRPGEWACDALLRRPCGLGDLVGMVQQMLGRVVR
jgi:hypothetical protein